MARDAGGGGMSERKWTPGPWGVKVDHSSSTAIDRKGAFASLYHAVVIDGHSYTVALTRQRVADVKTTPLPVSHYGPGYIRQETYNESEVDYTPHPDASLISAAPELFEALDEAINYLAVWAATKNDEKAADLLSKGTAALAKATAAS